MRGHLTEKADVFSFGVLALEVVAGRPNADPTLVPDQVYLLDWVLLLSLCAALVSIFFFTSFFVCISWSMLDVMNTTVLAGIQKYLGIAKNALRFCRPSF
jgi:hypothetical protein